MTAKKFKIKKDDTVIIRTGKDKGKKGRVLQLLTDSSTVIVEGVNIVTKHVKPTQFDKGGITHKESRIHISNVAFVDPTLDEATKIGYKINQDGTKQRFAKKSGQVL